jgi:hypothetical protein
MELAVMVTSPRLKWRKGSNAANEGGQTLEIRNKPRKPKMNGILYKICRERWEHALIRLTNCCGVNTGLTEFEGDQFLDNETHANET